jgi:asparagine synthase (glutamine-hydrolysing)
MCGICGIVSREPGPDRAADVRAQCATIRHRGPDDEGVFSDACAALGMRRLSIIDLSTGRQPMGNEDGSVQVVFNGEIYNFQTLRADLEKKGHTFHTRSDTEVIPHLYEEFGENFVDHLNGMFGIAVWDAAARTLLLTRDRIGIKPLYYAPLPDRLVFGSEAKAVLAAPGVSRAMDPFGLNQYLTYEYIPPPRSIFRDIKKLAPGEQLIYKNGTVRVRRYWDPPADPPMRISEHEAAEQLRELILDAVRLRLIADVPLGVFLSGGLDSTTTTACAARFSPHIKSFCIGFDEPSFDESAHARRAAQALGTDHHEDCLSLKKALELLPGIFDLLDEPLSDPSLLPTYLLSRFTRRHVTVSLSGDGGDELFAGYPTYQAHKLHGLYRRVPAPLRAAGLRAARMLPASEKNMNLPFKIIKFAEGAAYDPMARQFVWLGPMAPNERNAFLHPDFLKTIKNQDVFEPARQALGPVREKWSDVDIAMFTDLRFYLGENLMTKVDRTSMMHSLEARTPLLDHRIVEFAWRLPTHFKLNGLKTKHILRKAAAPLVPDFVLKRGKKGFGIPLTKWIKDDLKEMFRETLSHKALADQGLFNPDAVQRLLQAHLSGREDQHKKLWNLFVFHQWQSRWA